MCSLADAVSQHAFKMILSHGVLLAKGYILISYTCMHQNSKSSMHIRACVKTLSHPPARPACSCVCMYIYIQMYLYILFYAFYAWYICRLSKFSSTNSYTLSVCVSSEYWPPSLKILKRFQTASFTESETHYTLFTLCPKMYTYRRLSFQEFPLLWIKRFSAQIK
jgi:hypothetical protein